LYRLEREIKNTDKAFIAVSFIQRGGMEQMFKMLKKILEIKKEVIIYTSGYLRITDPEALEDLLSIKPSYKTLKVYFNPKDRFHAKFILLNKPRKNYTLFLGSSNISVEGLKEIGELNIQIKGNTNDQVYKNVKIVINNLMKDKNFKEINEDVIEEYKNEYNKTKKKFPGENDSGKKPNREYFPKEEMPIYIGKDEFNINEIKKIKSKRPEWENCVSMMPNLRNLKEGDYFLIISNIKNKKKTFNVSKYQNDDRIGRLGNIAYVINGKKLPLSKLEKRFNISRKEILKLEKLNIYQIAILEEDFKEAFA
jgi:HKD family nuclease